MEVTNQKTPIFRIIIFITLFFIIFINLSYLFRPVNHNSNRLNGFYSQKQNSLDMVYIGGSVSFVYYSPIQAFHQFGFTSYNYGVDTMQAETMKYAIKEVLKKQKPKLILLDARPFQYRDSEQPPNNANVRNISDNIPYSINRINMINNIIKYQKEFDNSLYFDIIKYHTIYENISLSSIYNYLKNDKNLVDIDYKGFFFVPKIEKLATPTNFTIESEPVSKETEEILINLLKYCKNVKDVKFLFVISPYQESIEDRKINNYIANIIRDYNFDYINTNSQEYYKQMKLDFSKDFYNYTHTNIFGAEKYTNFIGRYVKEKYNLPDRKDDEAYSEWNELYDNWVSSVNTNKEVIENELKSGGN